jgi:mRNA interferase RelE/StbE
MKVNFNRKFAQDLRKINNQKLKENIKCLIVELEESTILDQIANVTKLKGHAFAYRIRIGDYRMGLFYENDIVEIVRFLKRNDIYKVFP